MAITKDNVIIKGVTGKFANSMVFRQKGKTTVIAKIPKKREKPATPQQLAQQFVFTEASFYAKSAIEDPVLKAAYKAKVKGNQSAYNVAFKDFLTAPILHKVDWSKYDGAVGSTLTCRITDVLAVLSVKVSLFDAAGVLIEEGAAVQSSIKLDWVYTATVAHTPVLGTRVLVQMTDTPQNVYLDEAVIV